MVKMWEASGCLVGSQALEGGVIAVVRNRDLAYGGGVPLPKCE